MKVDIFNTDKKYQIIYADCPWSYKVWNLEKCGHKYASHYYQTMNLTDLCDLPIADIADKNCILFLWTTPPCIKEAFQVLKSWEFEYKTKAFCWVKQNKNGMGLFMGMGYWTRSNTEDCWLATKGNPKRVNAGIHQVIMSPLGKHSRKPDEIVRDNIVALCGDLPRIELFARRQVEGWDCWGDQC